jgi:RNA polymerase sigma-70 factor (ECF subfamily)
LLRTDLLRSEGVVRVIPAEARGAFHEIEVRLRPYVSRRVASPADADDVLQEILLRMHRGVTTLEESERFGPWVYGIAKRAIADHFRDRARHPLASSSISETNAERTGSDDGGDELESELAECVALFVARLPSPYREAITLTELEGLTQREAAEMLGLSVSGMKSRVQRGRAQVREMFESCCELSIDARGRVTSCDPRAMDEVPEDCRPAAVSWAMRPGR